MDLQWVPPSNDEAECNFLEDNFINCIKEKSVRDQVPQMKCNVEQIIWFNLECPERYKDYEDPTKLRTMFMQIKKGKGLDRPAYVKL